MASKRSSRSRRPERVEKDAAAAHARPGLAGVVAWRWLWLAGVLAVAVLVYWPALGGPFIFDDYHLPFSDPNARGAGAAFWIGGVRPALMATYWINFVLSGKAFSYHAGNVLLHAITAGIVFFLLKRLLELAGVDEDRTPMAVFGAGMFLLHPLQTESVAYIAGRSEVVAGLFFTAAWLVFVNNFGSATKVRTALWILLLAGLAVAGKESAISLPAILFLTDLYWNPASLMQQVRSRVKLWVPIVLGGLVAAGMILRSLTRGTGAGFGGQEGVTPAQYALTQCRVILIYIRIFLLPVGQNGDWKLPFFKSVTDHAAWIYVVVMLAFVALIVGTYRKARLLSFGLATFLVMLLPTSSVVPIIDAVAERRMYLPIIGLILASIWAIVYYRPRLPALQGTRNLRIAFVLLLTVEAGLSFARNRVWGNDISFWADSAGKNPANTRALMGLGDAYVMNRRCGDAVRVYRDIERQAGITDEIESNLATAYQCNNQPDVALGILRTLVATHPSSAKYAQVGYLEAKTSGDSDAALGAIQKALDLDPRNANAYAYRGVIRLTLGDRPDAAADLQHALEIEPDNATAKYGMNILNGQNMLNGQH